MSLLSTLGMVSILAGGDNTFLDGPTYRPAKKQQSPEDKQRALEAARLERIRKNNKRAENHRKSSNEVSSTNASET